MKKKENLLCILYGKTRTNEWKEVNFYSAQRTLKEFEHSFSQHFVCKLLSQSLC